MQVGSDGMTACATGHWNAGAYVHLTNQVHPGAPGSEFGRANGRQRNLADEATAGLPTRKPTCLSQVCFFSELLREKFGRRGMTNTQASPLFSGCASLFVPGWSGFFGERPGG